MARLEAASHVHAVRRNVTAQLNGGGQDTTEAVKWLENDTALAKVMVRQVRKSGVIDQQQDRSYHR